MGSRPSPRLAVQSLALILTLASAAWAGDTTTLVYSFAGNADGEYLDTELVRDSAGNLYGTSVQGGAFASGTVFEVTPDGAHTVLYNFRGGRDGGEPYKGVTLGPDGNLYGTTVAGGSGLCDGGCGVVFKLTRAGDTWTQSVLHSFTGGNHGSGPGSPVAFDNSGALYGTTPTGGKYGMGVVYQIRPTLSGWKFRVVHPFTGGADGGGGSAGKLLIDQTGSLYGTCTTGGVNGFGTVYELSPPSGQQSWKFTTLYAFKDQPDGALPYSSLVFGQDGDLYGTTYYAGANDLGTVYKLSHQNGIWTETVLYSFQGNKDGANPISNLVADASGNLWGTTSAGGSLRCGCGVIFKMTRTWTGGWAEHVIYRFPGAPSLGQAYNGLVVDVDGNFYGSTVHGGANDDGAIYKITP